MDIPRGVTIASLVRRILKKISCLHNKMWKGWRRTAARDEQWPCGKMLWQLSVWKKRPVTQTQKRIDRMPKIMRAIMEAEGFKTPYWVCICSVKSVCTMGILMICRPPKNTFFLAGKKFGKSAGIGRGCLEGSWIDVGRLTRNIWRLSIKKLCSEHHFWKKYGRSKGGGLF